MMKNDTGSVEVSVSIPDDLEARVATGGGDLSRRALEAWALEGYKRGALPEYGLRRMLGYGTRYQLDGFLKAHRVWVGYTVDDFHR